MRDRIYLVPLLGRGSHTGPRTGGCLMEVVAALASGPWTAYPPAVDPVLATVGRAVNDQTSDDARAGLAPMIPWLVLPVSPDTLRAAAVAAAIAADAALPFADPPTQQQLTAVIDHAAAVLASDTGGLSRLTRQRQRRQATAGLRQAIAVVARAPSDRRDAALRCLLLDVLDHHRRLNGLPPIRDGESMRRSRDECRGSVAVAARLIAPDGGESLQLHCSAVIRQWPPWLQRGWEDRRAELDTAGARTAAAPDRVRIAPAGLPQ